MKKILLILCMLTLLLMPALLVGCGGGVSADKLLGNYAPWMSETDVTETSVYEVVRPVEGAAALRGTYTVTVRRVYDAAVTVGEKTIENYNGYYAESKLEMENGDSIVSQATFSTKIVVGSVFYDARTDGERLTYTCTYENKKAVYTGLKVAADGAETPLEGSVKHKAFDKEPYTDNVLLYLVARCVPQTNTLNIKVPKIDGTDETAPVVITATNQTEDVALGGPEDVVAEEADLPAVPCRVVTVAVNRTFPKAGTPLKCHIALKYMNGSQVSETYDERTSVKDAIVRITEGNVVYRLISCQKSY